MTLPRLYIFDLDGTLRWTTTPGARYPRRVDEWRLMPGVAERLSSIPWSASGPWLATASNQCGIGEGHLDRETAHGLAVACLVAAIGRLPAGARVDFCDCSEGSKCRRQKSRPGLLIEALAHFGAEAHDALYVGDLDIDSRAAEAPGIPFAWAADFFGGS